ncbi:hypothetical protein INT48_004136 [Thamnidium elegans]|uniref:F-box domain-containing protein n=1 Tax=Thamnidium elegans TaxID=101142 RepID=A0A8H7VZS2_9FUNG|nr:hypothetical protein INT48_004136 [Thamnidium elegans]
MNYFPNEVLAVIFSYLSPNDLVKCQLANNNWNKYSLQSLYSKVTVNSYFKVLRYVNAISSSPQRAKYLKSIDVGSMFASYEDINFWGSCNLIEALINYCPNITKIIAKNTCSQFWSRMHSAAKRNTFANLQVLPAPSVNTLDCYILCALLYKKTLTSLTLTDRRTPSESNSTVDSKSYQIILSRIDEFCNLTHLHFGLYDNQQLDYFDTVIESCKSIQSLTFHLVISTLPTKTLTPNVILPRPEIHTLVCDWGFINQDYQLEYIIKKFPSLQSFIVPLGPYNVNGFNNSVSAEAMVKLLQYTLTIPNFRLEFALQKHNVMNIWIELMRTTGFGTNICIDYKYLEGNSNGLVINFENDLATFYFSPIEDFFYPSHIDFISKIGRRVQSIDIKNNTNERHLYQILESCHSLQTFTCHKPIDMKLPEFINFQHKNLKAVTMSIHGSDVSFDYLTRLSLNLPNLELLFLIDQKTFRLNSTRNIRMTMTNTRLNMLSWSGESSSGIVHDRIRCYIRTNTALGERFYTGSKKGMFKITEQYYTQSFGKLYFDITCHKLDKFKLTIRDLSRAEKEKTYIWTF